MMPHVSRGTNIAVGAAVLLSGCLSIKRPPEDLSKSQLDLPPAYAAAPHASRTVVADNWTEEFRDQRILDLVDEALRRNPDLSVAAARREEAQARLQIAASYLQPDLNAVIGASKTDPNDLQISNHFDLRLRVSWELDLWGRIRSEQEAARATAEASGWDLEFARQSLAATVADSWFLAVAAQLQLAINRELLQAEQFTARVTRDRIEVGAASRLDSEVAEANLSLAEEAVHQSRGALLEVKKALEVLLGRYPVAELQVTGDLPSVPSPTPIGVPSELLERRPDIIAADRKVAAAFYNEQAAQAARLPRLELSATLGTLLDPTQSIWSIGANLLAPLFTGGRLKGDVLVATAQQRQELGRYVSVALRAFREVETALANEQVLVLRQAQLEQADARLRSASRIAQDRYNAGLLTILELTQVRRQDFAIRSQLLRVRTERLRQRLNLLLALGGSFDTRETLR